MPFSGWSEELQPAARSKTSTLVQALFDSPSTCRGRRSHRRDWNGDEAAGEIEAEGADFDLCMEAGDNEQGFQLEIVLPRGPVRRETIVSMAALPDVAGGRGRRSGPASLATAAAREPEREQVLVEWNRTQVDFPRPGCVHQLFEAQVQRGPRCRRPWCSNGQTMSYRQLNARANQLA